MFQPLVLLFQPLVLLFQPLRIGALTILVMQGGSVCFLNVKILGRLPFTRW